MILMYHKVDVVAPTIWWVSRKKFAQHMKALSKFEVVHLDDYNSGDTSQCVITFDDCYENVYRHAFPILKEYGYPFELFVIGNYIGEWNKFDLKQEPATRFSNLRQLKEMAANGGRIQWHTADHFDLARISFDRARNQMNIPGNLIELFPPPHFSWFSYPYGSATTEIIDQARILFKGAVGVETGENSNKYNLKRTNAHEDLDISMLQKKPNMRIGSRLLNFSPSWARWIRGN